MAGQTPYEAYQNYIGPLRESASCVTSAVLYAQEGGYNPRELPYAVTFGEGPDVRIDRTAGAHFGLRVTQHYKVEKSEDTRLGPWKVRTYQYIYALLIDVGQAPIFAYHWHPNIEGSRDFPHIHLGAGAGATAASVLEAHLPTQRISLEEFLRTILVEFGVRPMRDNWGEILERNQSAFEGARTWR